VSTAGGQEIVALSPVSKADGQEIVAVSPVSTADGQEIVAVLAEPFQTRYGEDASFIGEYGSRQHRLEQPILEELDETSGDLASDDVSDFACTTDI